MASYAAALPKGTKYTYALLGERVSASPKLTKDEALSKLARIYFSSHGPAILEDFTWWSGLTITDVRKALQMVKADLQSEEIDSQTFWFDNSLPDSGSTNQAYLLPAYDEFIISYKDRNAMIADEHHAKAVSNNGIFRPVIVVNGQVAGTWKRSVKKDALFVETNFFDNPTEEIIRLVKKAAEKFAAFLGNQLVMN